jgi:hypothetical protein
MDRVRPRGALRDLLRRDLEWEEPVEFTAHVSCLLPPFISQRSATSAGSVSRASAQGQSRTLAQAAVPRPGAASAQDRSLGRSEYTSASAASAGQLSQEEGRRLGDLVTEELAASGLGAHYDPTPYGRRLEDIIDALTDA